MTSIQETRRGWVLASILLAMFMVAIEGTIIATAMPDIVARLGGFELYSWVFSGFLLTQTVTAVLFGKMADLVGRRPVLIAGIGVFLVGSVLCGMATSMPALIVFRLLQGLGAGSILPVATTIVGDLYSPQERASIQGYLSSVWGISAVIGPLAGGLIVERLSWPWVFWINIPVGLATVALLVRCLHEQIERKAHRIDVTGAALFAVGTSALLVSLTLASQEEGSPLGPLLLGLAALAGFVWQERRTEEPMLPMEIWRHRVISSANVASLLAGMTLIGVTTFLAVYVQAVMGRSATVAGFALTTMAIGWPIASVLARRFYDRVGMRATLRIGAILLIAGTAMLILLTPTTSPMLAGGGSLVMGFGMGLLNITIILLVQGSVGWGQRGTATASNVFARNLGSTLGAAVLGALLNFSMQGTGVTPAAMRRLLDESQPATFPEIRQALDRGLHTVFIGVTVLAVLTYLVSLYIPDRTLEELSEQV